MYRAVDEHGQVVDVLLRDHRDTASAEAFFRQVIERAELVAEEIVTDHHQPYVKAVATTCPGAQHIRPGLHRARGETTKASERSHVPMRDRLRNSRGLKRTETGSAFWKASKRCATCGAAGGRVPATCCVAQRTIRTFGG